MNLITEQVFTQPPYNGCHLKARVVTKNAEKPFYLLIDNEESLKERIVSYFKDNNMGNEDNEEYAENNPAYSAVV